MRAKYYYAYDPNIHRRVVHVLVKGFLISLVTGHKFKFNKKADIKLKGQLSLISSLRKETHGNEN